ncbi:MAG: SDR family oxidoreductase [Gemmatimonadetes bacterium]|nr:SDR family oxidoreductase [Gemmatimonadota bacterium]
MGLLEGKKALLTGSRRGIGAGIATLFAEHGADVGLNSPRPEPDEVAGRVIAAIEACGRRATWHPADVGDTAARERMFDEFLAAHGRIDILVNNAVTSDQMRSFFETDEEFWDFLMGHALKGYFFAAKRAASEMIRQGGGGRIINISSVHAYRAWPDDTVYGVIKAGLNRMVKSMAVDLAGTGITCNCIAPGYIDIRVLPPEEEPNRGREGWFDEAHAYIPSRRAGAPRHIAGAALFLASELGDYVNGETILVDGGLLSGGTPDDRRRREPRQ